MTTYQQVAPSAKELFFRITAPFLAGFAIAVPLYIGYIIYLNRLFFNKAVFILLIILGFLASVIAFSATCLIIYRMFLKGQEWSLQNKSRIADLNLYSATAQQIQDNQIFLTEQKNNLGVVKFKQLPKHAKAGMNSAEVLPQLSFSEEIKNTLLADIESDANILVIAPKQRAGKTTMLGHIATSRLKRGDIVKVFDPHFDLNQECWPPECEFIGKKRNYQEIKEGLEALLKELDYRLNNKIKTPQISFFMDEMKTVCEEVGASSYFKNILTEGMKVGIYFCGAGHSTRVKALGLEGMGDLFEGFDSILYLSKQTRQVRRAVFDENGNEINSFYHHPGKLEFLHHNIELKQSELKRPVIEIDSDFNSVLNGILNKPLDVDVMSKEERILKAYHELVLENKIPIGKNDIARKAFNYEKCNGRLGKEISATLEGMPFFQ
jgi:hypothetical protein